MKIGKYWAIFRTQVLNSLAYPGDLASRSLSIVMFMWIFTQLWRAAYKTAGATSIAGLTLHDTLWYLMLAETIILSKPRLSSAIASSVKDGSIAYLLNKPYNFLLYQMSVSLGDSIIQMIFNVLAGGALVWLLLGPPPNPLGWPFTLLAMALAWLIDFSISALIGLSAFVTEDVAAFEWIYSKILFLLGGLLIPLDFFPEWLRAIAQSLPFSATVYGPARFFVDPTPAGFLALAARQCLWLALAGATLALTFRRSMTWLSINGG